MGHAFMDQAFKQSREAPHAANETGEYRQKSLTRWWFSPVATQQMISIGTRLAPSDAEDA